MYSAMKSREKDKAVTLRVLMSSLKNFKIENKNNLSDSDGIRVIKKLVKQRKDSAEIYKNANRLDLAAKEEFELDVLSSYMPKMYSEAEIRALIKVIIQDMNAKNLNLPVQNYYNNSDHYNNVKKLVGNEKSLMNLFE